MKLQDGESVTLAIAGADVSLNAATITEMFLERLRGREEPATVTLTIEGPDLPPALGMPWRGGIYAGIVRGDPGAASEVLARDHHLVVLDEAEDALDWKAAMAWAGERAEGSLPTRRELALCFANARDLFQSTWYWSCEQYAGLEAYAWCQYFSFGFQSTATSRAACSGPGPSADCRFDPLTL
jgi:hypothetical protein